mgnify:CR=1 FL=1
MKYFPLFLDFQQAISIKPKHAASHEYLAEGFRAIGEDELAQQHQDIADALRGERIYDEIEKARKFISRLFMELYLLIN